MSFYPRPTRVGFILLGVAVVSAIVAVYILSLLPKQNSPPVIFMLSVGLLSILSLMGLALYWTVAAFRLRYYIDRNGLAIQWGLASYLIPIDNILSILPGEKISSLSNFRGLNIDGLRFGRSESPEYGRLNFHTTAPLADSLLITTSTDSYIISPAQPDRFIKAWQERRRIGSTQQLTAGLYRSWPLNAPFLADTLTFWLWGLAGFICLALFGYLAFTFSGLPPALLKLPTMGAAVIIINILLGSFIYRYERVASYLLWGGTVVTQFWLWLAVLMIVD